MPPADTGASVVIARSDASAPSSLRSLTSLDTDDRLMPGGSGYRRMSFGLFAAGVATFALLYSTQALLPAISAGLGVTPDEASWTVSAATGGLAIAVVPLSALSERFGRRTMITAALCVAAVVALLVPFAPSLGWLVGLRVVQGAALAGVPASAMAYLAEEVRPKALVGAIGLFVAGNSIGGMTGRILAGWAAQAWGWRAGLAAVGALAVVCAVAFRLLIPRARHFTPSPVSARSLARTVGTHHRSAGVRSVVFIAVRVRGEGFDGQSERAAPDG
ncbi:MFS transporter, partial [Streptomyces sp. NPDC049577]|uniref:MFS transporter n=1 Tax=Streptomyces sp. NPDC049577 TaxID=3155153 RepID=UPI00341CC191